MHSVNTHEIRVQRMKVVPKKDKVSNNDRKTGFLPPPIPLERAEAKKLQKDDYLVMKLRSIPNKATSPVYELNIPYFKDGTSEEWFKFLENFKKVLVGQDLNTGATQFAMARRLLTGDTLSQFDKKFKELKTEAVTAAEEGTAVTDSDIETAPNLRTCMRAVTVTVLPQKALQTQKRYMRRILRKPQGMKIRDYFARYIELNEYLPHFPPFDKDQELPDDEILEHAEFAIPNSWQKQMVMHGFNTISRTMDDFIEFCERLELSENLYDTTHLKSQKTSTQTGSGTTPKGGNGKSTGKQSGKNRKSTKYYCLYHGENSTHNTDQCKVLKAQAERMANQHAQKGAGKYKGRNDSDEKKKRKAEFQSFAADVVEKVFKKMKKSSSGNNKKKENFSFSDFQDMSVSSDDSSDSE